LPTAALDRLIHDPRRLRIVATLAVLPDGDALSVTRLQDMLGLTAGTLISGLRELDGAGYVRTDRVSDHGAQTTVALTRHGRTALDRYTAALRRRHLLAREIHPAPASQVRVGDADREAAAAALGEHFAQGRLTLDELNARLDATLTATTQGDLCRAARDLPDLAVLPGRIGSRRSRATPEHKTRPPSGEGVRPHRRDWTRRG
jgi:DNA-binding MarR family transcriptional regulator